VNIFLDCTRGISGDMTLAALGHLGVEIPRFAAILADAGIDCRLESWQENRAAGPGWRVEVSWDEAQPLRHPADLAAVFQRLGMSARARERALSVLNALTAAEAYAHDIPSEEVHFHEVGAIDTLVDIAGVCWALEELRAVAVTASPLPWFSGVVECAHGLVPLPAPATAFLMRGKPVFPVPEREELVTPTGAALVHALATAFADGPTGRVRAVGTGYGSRPSSTGLRAWLMEPETAKCMGGGLELVTQLETHLDHLTGEEAGAALTALAETDETLDVLWLTGIGKKNRPLSLLRVLCRPEHADFVCNAILRHTHSLGVRRQCLERVTLPRKATSLECAGEKLAAKSYVLEGREYARGEADALNAHARGRNLGMPALRFASDGDKFL
jgi:uncharacterized protein (TIGR00299 family) protein